MPGGRGARGLGTGAFAGGATGTGETNCATEPLGCTDAALDGGAGPCGLYALLVGDLDLSLAFAGFRPLELL